MSEESSQSVATSTPEEVAVAAARPMRLAKREVTDPAELAAIIQRARVVRVGFTDAEGMAIVPMNFGVEWPQAVPNDQATESPEGESAKATLPTFWLHSAGSGRKAEAWASSPEVALELDVEGGVIGGDYACAYSYAYESVMAWGRIRPAADLAEKRHGLAQIMAHMAPGAPVEFSDEALGRVAVWRIDVERMTGKRRAAKASAQTGGSEPAAPTPDETRPAADATEEPEKPKKKDGHKDKADKTKGEKVEKAKTAKAKGDKDGKKDKEGKPKKDKKKGRTEMGLLEAIEAKLTGKGKRGDVTDEDLKRKKKADRKALEKATEEVLKGQRCDGCGHHCKLIDPRCGKGRKLRAKRLAKAGIRE